MSLSRRHLLGLGGVATAAGLLGLGACSRAAPPPPKRARRDSSRSCTAMPTGASA